MLIMINPNFRKDYKFISVYNIVVILFFVGAIVAYHMGTSIPKNYIPTKYNITKITSDYHPKVGVIYTQSGIYEANDQSYPIKVVIGTNPKASLNGTAYYNPSNPAQFKLQTSSARYFNTEAAIVAAALILIPMFAWLFFA